jgi:hypothetical protein
VREPLALQALRPTVVLREDAVEVEVAATSVAAVLVVHVHLGLHPRTARQDEADPQPALHGRLAARLEVRHGVPGLRDPAQAARPVDGLLEEVEGRRAGTQSGIPAHDALDQAVRAGHVDEGTRGGHDEQPADLAELLVSDQRAVRPHPRPRRQPQVPPGGDVQLLPPVPTAGQDVDPQHPERRPVAQDRVRGQDPSEGRDPGCWVVRDVGEHEGVAHHPAVDAVAHEQPRLVGAPGERDELGPEQYEDVHVATLARLVDVCCSCPQPWSLGDLPLEGSRDRVSGPASVRSPRRGGRAAGRAGEGTGQARRR